MRISKLILALTVLAPGAASAQVFDRPHRFIVSVEENGAIGPGGVVDISKISVSLRTRYALRSAEVATSIYSVGPAARTLVVTLVCGYGPLSSGQTATYYAQSCNPPLFAPVSPAGRWQSDSVVIYTDATDAKTAKVRSTAMPTK